MALLTKVLDQFDAEARKEGGRLRSRGDVKILQHTANTIEASIFAGQSFGVVLERKKGEIVYSCECGDYQETLEPCKHVWAAIVECDALGYLAGWERGVSIELVPAEEYADAWDEDDDDYDDDDLLDPDDELVDEPVAGPTVFFDQTMSNRLSPAPKSSSDSSPSRGGKAQAPKKPSKKKVDADEWKRRFQSLRQAMHVRPALMPGLTAGGGSAWPAGRELLYVIDIQQTLQGDGLVIELLSREPKKTGGWSKPKKESLGTDDTDRLPDPADQEIIALLSGARQDQYGYFYASHARSSRYRLQHSQFVPMVQRMCATGRCFTRVSASHEAELLPMAWDEAARWEFVLKIERDAERDRYVVSGELRSGEDRMPLTEPLMLLAGGLLFTRTHVARFNHSNAFTWVTLLRSTPRIEVPLEAAGELLKEVLSLPQVPKLEAPEELKYENVQVTPTPRLRLHQGKKRSSYYASYEKPKLHAELSFDYGGQIVEATDISTGIYDPQTKRYIPRDAQAERNAKARLLSVGFREPRSGYYYDKVPQFELAPAHLPAVIRTLTAEQWYVEADGQLYRQPGEIRVEVSSGIDWFELHGTADFGDQKVALPELLKALQRGEKTVRLGDGTFGVLPEEWLKKYGILAGMGEEEGNHLKFKKTQVGLLDALLAAQPQITCDALFEEARQRLRSFEGVRAADPPPTFTGTLRPYQREGLGWLEFLRAFGFGGCLADDMGLGKTVQVLALLEERRLLRAGAPSTDASAGASSNGNGKASKAPEQVPGPSMVVAPRSLVFNWMEEAKRFAPQLRVLDHTGAGRAKSAEAFANADVILTTYGTMRNDINFLKDVRFDYVVLDEAQAIKNAASESAKASRILNADQRLALSGTPVQNHLGELWSLFEFLNPGMLGSARVLQMTASGSQKIDEDTRAILSRALRPFILRRTKGQVAKELPQRVEQTIHCELDAKQRALYNELKEHYRQSLLSRIAKEGLNKSKIQILEALLRLRQAACHPALIDKSKADQGSAKLDSLLPQLAEVIDGGHKALVFSQFTSFLSLVRSRLDKEKIRYEYLDGRTRDRQAVVDRFQTDEKCPLFLISLKAGGVGLNLTAAEYVFLLDPWWNPAVEAQAIDRAHRIGQTRQVFAYRLIAKDTVEEKVLQLQESKRELADAIINADNSVISKLGREDLELLLS